MKQVVDWEGVDITDIVENAASVVGLDPIALLALLKAESSLRRKAQRFGLVTNEFLQRLMWYEHGDHSQEAELQRLLNDAWPDVSFGFGQQIVLYHYAGDHSANLENVLAVRKEVFDHPEINIANAADRLASYIPRSLDGTVLGGMVVYNAGSDRRDDPVWMERWAGNVATYEEALEWAEGFRESIEPGLLEHLDQIWGVAQELRGARHDDLAGRIEERVVAIKPLVGL